MDEQQTGGPTEPTEPSGQSGLHGPSGSSGSSEQGEPGWPRRPSNPRMRRVAASVCAVEAVVLVGFCLFYLWEIARGESNDAGRAVGSTLLIAVLGAALGFLARAWVRGAGWPNTPTIVWNVLLLPIAWTVLTGGQPVVGVLVGVVAVVGIIAAARAGDPAVKTGAS